MAKITPDTIASQFASTTALNNNFAAIATELNNKVLYRDNPIGEPNSMNNDLDMNSNDLLNVGNLNGVPIADLSNISAYVDGAAASASAASASASAASASASAAAATYDAFDDRYLGSKASDPALDNDGNALTAGALYFNTSDFNMYVYTGAAWITLSSAFVYFAEERNTTAPNASVPVHAFSANGAGTDLDIAIVAKGTGATLAQIPDNTSAGGNKRGNSAVDLQKVRSAASQVASGIASAILGGGNNTASGNYSACAGGLTNTASGQYSICSGGFQLISSGNYSACLAGSNNTASGANSVCVGGGLNIASGDFSSTLGGYRANTRGIYGKQSFASGAFAAEGDAQIGAHTQRITTTDATATILTSDGAAPSATNVSVLPDNYSYTVHALVVGRDTATGDTGSYEIKASVKRGAGAATTALVGSATVTTIAEDAGAAAWNATIVANTTRGSVEIQVTGAAATTIRWVGKLTTIEVG